MEKDLVDIIMEKSYIELSANEKAELGEYCSSESEYNQMKDVFHGVEMMQVEIPTPRKETKESLDSLFDSSFPKAAPVWYMSALAVIVPKEKAVHRQPLLQIAAIGLLAFLAYPFFNSDVVGEVPQFAQAEYAEPEVTDTKTTFVAEPIKPAEVVDVKPSKPILVAVVSPQPVGPPSNPVHPDGIWDASTEMGFSQPASESP
ncbi:MAG: hypothetical protein HRT57_06735, partial [Crocinitomicaceae bacterium]|nr:hypothetical protein [Crocinitomicaceae bacterium]